MLSHLLALIHLVTILSFFTHAHSLNPRFLREPPEILQARLSSLSSSRNPKSISQPTVYRCGEIGKDLVANFVNRNYPENDVAGEECRFRLVINGPHVCQVRIDFVDTEMIPPTKGDCLSQTLEVNGSIWPTGLVPLCGTNNDQHFYLHLQPWSANSSWVDFRLTTVLTGKPYRFGVWLTQIDCSNFNVLKAPEGCTQYFLGEKGTIKSFNFEGSSYLNGNNYRICIRPGKGVCGVRYEASQGDFGIRKSILASREIHFKSGSGPNICGLDYLLIPDGRDSIQTLSTSRKNRLLFLRRPQRPNVIIVNQSPPATTAASVPSTTTQTIVKKMQNINNKNKIQELKIFNDRYCGGVLSPFGGETVSKPVFVRVRSNLMTIHVHTASTVERKNTRRNNVLNMTTGFRISYSQLRDCEDNETDMVSEPNIVQLLHNFNMNHAYLPPLFRDQAETESSNGMQANQIGNDGNSTNDENLDVPDEDSLWDYLDESADSEEPSEDEDENYDF